MPIHRPLDVGRMTNKNFSTPKRAEFNLNLIKKKLADKNKKIKCLTDFNQKLVKSLKEMVKVLDRQNNMLSEQATQIHKVTRLHFIFNSQYYIFIIRLN